MQISDKHIASKRVVGKLNGKDVMELVTTGGLYMNVLKTAGKPEVLSTGPHRAIARHIATKNASGEIHWSELSKGDHIDEADYAFLLPRYEQLTDYIRSLHSEE